MPIIGVIELQKFTFVTPERVVCEWGGATNGVLPHEAKRLGKRPLIVAGNSLATSGKLEAILLDLHKAGLSPIVHTGVPAEPDLDALQKAMDAVQNADSVIAIGGGSVLDVAKGAAALAGTGYTARDYHSGKVAVPDKVRCPILAVPTTAGTGSEATWVGVFTDKETGKKSSIRGGSMMPKTVLLDAELTISCPPSVTAHSGMDAFVQAVESFTSLGANSLTEGLALEAAQNIVVYLALAFTDPQNREAREEMLLNSYMAGIALNTSRLGLVHGLAHPIGAITGTPHGLVCGMLMPAVTEFNSEVSSVTKKYDDVMKRESENGSVQLMTMVTQWLNDFHCPTRLSEIGLREEHLDQVAREAMVSGSTKANPRTVREADARAVVAACL